MHADSGQRDSNRFDILVQPFSIHFECSDYHVMLYMTDHPEYESIEAMIKEREPGKAFIRAIITRLDQTQVDHINDRDVVEKLKISKRNREIYYTPILYRRETEHGKAHIALKFSSFKGEEIEFDFHSSAKASSKHTGLIDPGGHSMHTSLPVMYPERTTLAGPESKIVIGGISYKIPVKIHIPLFYKGMKGYYSELFNMGVLRAGTELLEVIRIPSAIRAGEQWVYKSGTESSVYGITEVKGNLVEIGKENEQILADISGGAYSLKKISLFSRTMENPNAQYSLEFTPALPIFPMPGGGRRDKIHFSISLNEHISLVTGTATADTVDNAVKLLLVPAQPEWAVRRAVRATIETKGGKFSRRTEILN